MKKSKFALRMFFVSLIAGIFITYFIVNNGFISFDKSAASMFAMIFPEETQQFFLLVTVLGSKKGIGTMAILLILWLWFWKKNFAGIVLVVVSVGVGNEASNFFKEIIQRPRPKLEHLVEVHSYSYPSGHAMVGIILFFLIAYFIIQEFKRSSYKWIIGIMFALIIFLVGTSRIVLQVHYPSDVFGGFFLGYIWIYLLIFGYEVIRKREKQA